MPDSIALALPKQGNAALALKGAEAMKIREDQNRIQSLRQVSRSKADEAKIDQVAEEFEAVFISQMLEHMFAGIETDETFGGGHAEDVYRSLLVDEYGKLIAKTGGIGVADHVKREMLTLQEVE